MPATINYQDLSNEERTKLGLMEPVGPSLSEEECRSWALKVLGVISRLTRTDRAAILRFAWNINKV